MSCDSRHRHKQIFSVLNFSCLKPKIQKDPTFTTVCNHTEIKSKRSFAHLSRVPASLFNSRLMKSLFLLRVEQVVMSSSGNNADLSLINSSRG